MTITVTEENLNQDQDTIGLLDEKNTDLWNELCKIQKIQIKRDEFDNNGEKCEIYSVDYGNTFPTIHVPKHNLNPAIFTHELLHIYLKTKGIRIGEYIIEVINHCRKTNYCNRLFSSIGQKEINAILNYLEHIKIIHKFISLQYNQDEFVHESVKQLYENIDLNIIKNNFTCTIFNSKHYRAEYIILYLIRYFQLKSYQLAKIVVEKQLTELKKINKRFFGILENFEKSWEKLDYNDKEQIKEYPTLVDRFLRDFNKWIKLKRITCS